MPPKLDDLCKSGKISKGFKIANPDLKPEKLINFELGGRFLLMEKLTVETAVYYSLGNDFQYFVATGDSVDTGGDELKPVLQRNNISEVEIIGGEISLTYQFNKKMYFKANYTRNHSLISEMDFNQLSVDIQDQSEKELEGKYLYEVPADQAFLGFFWNNKWLNISVTYNYIGSQWQNDINTVRIESYDLLNCQLSRTFKDRFRLNINIQNILDKEFADRRGYVSPGRFVIGELGVMF